MIGIEGGTYTVEAADLQSPKEGLRPFPVEAISAELKKTQRGVDLHRHVEGILGPNELIECARIAGVQLGDEIPDLIRSRMSDKSKEPNIITFIDLLSTPWIRLILIKGLEQGKTAKDVFRPMIQKILQKAHTEGIGRLELLASSYALTTEGNLFEIPQKDRDSMKPYIGTWVALVEEARKETLVGHTRAGSQLHREKMWEYIRNNKHESGVEMDENPFTSEQYFEVIKECVEAESDTYVLAGHKIRETDRRMEVAWQLCLRRDAKPEQVLVGKTLSIAGQEFVSSIRTLYEKGLLYGVNMAGIEQVHLLEDFDGLFQRLKRFGIPRTAHAGEMTQEHADAAYHNLQYAVDTGMLRLGHGVRLVDNNQWMAVLRQEAIDRRITTEVCAESNRWTGVVPNTATHEVIFAVQEGLLPKKSVIFCDDDPVIAHSDHPLAEELALVCKYGKNLGFDTVEDLVQFYWEVGNKVRLPAKIALRNQLLAPAA